MSVTKTEAAKKKNYRLFISLRQIGYCDESRRARHFIEYGGKKIADQKCPLASLAVPLIEELLAFCDWQSDEAAESDLIVLKRFIDGLQVTPRENTP